MCCWCYLQVLLVLVGVVLSFCLSLSLFGWRKQAQRRIQTSTSEDETSCVWIAPKKADNAKHAWFDRAEGKGREERNGPHVWPHLPSFALAPHPSCLSCLDLCRHSSFVFSVENFPEKTLQVMRVLFFGPKTRSSYSRPYRSMSSSTLIEPKCM